MHCYGQPCGHSQIVSTAGCSINEALINAKQGQHAYGCVELKKFEQVSVSSLLVTTANASDYGSLLGPILAAASKEAVNSPAPLQE